MPHFTSEILFSPWKACLMQYKTCFLLITNCYASKKPPPFVI